jgi:hypothetical protein
MLKAPSDNKSLSSTRFDQPEKLQGAGGWRGELIGSGGQCRPVGRVEIGRALQVIMPFWVISYQNTASSTFIVGIMGGLSNSIWVVPRLSRALAKTVGNASKLTPFAIP